MRRTFKYRIYSNNKTFDKATNWLNLCRRLYNVALEQKISAYKQDKGTIQMYTQMKQLPELKVLFPEYKDINGQVLQEVLERLNKAYMSFFRRVKNGSKKVGFPRFKSRNRYDSFTLKQWGWKLNGQYLSVTNIGRFKLRLSRPIEGNIKTITIKRTLTEKWYVYFSCDNVPEEKLLRINKAVGIDVGIKSFCVDSDGYKVDNPLYMRQVEALLRRKQRQLCRKVKGSNHRQEARLQVARVHEKIVNQRNDFLHKLANYYIKNYDVIYIEDLAIPNMVRNHSLARSIADSCWGKFFEFMSYKAEEAGRTIIKIPRFEPSSKTCSECGAVNNNLTLDDRQWLCQSCGALHDRDHNAAKNILRVGQTLQEVTYENAQCVS